jgi:8-oxo-dGTP pyrophosphatase MutT (NUDIX family)
MLTEEVQSIIETCKATENVKARMRARLAEVKLTREENPVSHFCCYFLPYNADEGKVFLVYHKKAEKWLAPGGHIEPNESTGQTLNREISEELGVQHFFDMEPLPFLLTTTAIDNANQSCKEHLDIWFLMKTDGDNFKIDFSEFQDAKWVDFAEAEKLLTDPANLEAINFLKIKALRM